jgi:hypothetical protein
MGSPGFVMVLVDFMNSNGRSGIAMPLSSACRR